MLADDEELLRLCWWPEDIDENGILRPQAFRRDDLSGPDHGVSVDRGGLADIQKIRARADTQQIKKSEDRKSPKIATAVAGSIRAAAGEMEAGPGIFLVIASPIVDPDATKSNPAHAHISSRIVRRGSRINEARLRLIQYFSGPIDLAAS